MNGPEIAKAFARKWKERYAGQSAPIPFARAAKFFKDRLNEGASGEELLGFLDFYFNRMGDPFVERCCHSFGCFTSVYGRVVGGYLDEKKKREAANKTDANFQRLEEARDGRGEK